MKKMTLSELKPIFSDYADWLEGWQPVGKDKLVRVDEPIAQGLWLDRLRTGEYRPTFYIRNLCVPRKSGGMELHQFLPIKVQSLSRSRQIVALRQPPMRYAAFDVSFHAQNGKPRT